MRYDVERQQIDMSVGELCSLALLSGDIDCRRPSRARMYERAREGAKIHRRLQSEFGAGYHSEIELKNVSCLEDVYFFVKGRADGVNCHDGIYTVDEIKTVSGGRFASGEIDARHSAQLLCYAYFLCRVKELDGAFARMIYYNVDDGETSFSEKYFTAEELKARYIALLIKVLPRAKMLVERETVRRPSAANARFPYVELRDSQEEMIKECYRDIRHGNKLFCQAPTGIGKTVSTIFPSVKCLGERYADKIFYLTSKASIRREAYHALEKMNAAGARVRGCVISSRETMCACDAAKRGRGRLSSYCNPETCPYAKGYYDRLPNAVNKILSTGDIFDSAAIKAFAVSEGLCPYELSLDLSELCDVIVCDYNYVFSPTVYLKRYFDERENDSEKYIFLVDEAHNLPDRARDMYSSRLSKQDFEAVIALAGESSGITHACLSVISHFDKLGELCRDNMTYDNDGNGVGYYVSRDMPERMSEILSEFSQKCDNWMTHNTDSPAYFSAEELSFKVYEYKKICERFDGRYLTFINKNGMEVSVLLYCLDPSGQLSEALEKAVASVLFSATLTPTDYFADILGGGEKAVSVSFRSPFPSENLCVAVADGVSTRFDDREGAYRKVASCIAATVSAKAGNYMVFFPSYSFMERVHKIFSAKYPHVKTLVQKRNMTYSERENFLDAFKDDGGKLRIGFCVLGGSFSEGVDLPGRRLIGTVIVGVGLPGISDENNIIRDYYEEKCGMGYDYAYTYPGMNSVLQAVGRVIRTETDRGIAVLIDDRYSEPKYKALFPQEWKNVKFAGDAQSLAEIARRFWKNQE